MTIIRHCNIVSMRSRTTFLISIKEIFYRKAAVPKSNRVSYNIKSLTKNSRNKNLYKF